jgi:hypothetical protein
MLTHAVACPIIKGFLPYPNYPLSLLNDFVSGKRLSSPLKAFHIPDTGRTGQLTDVQAIP